MKKWEYKVVHKTVEKWLTSTKELEFLMEYGADGWELAGIIQGTHHAGHVIYYWKREIIIVDNNI